MEIAWERAESVVGVDVNAGERNGRAFLINWIYTPLDEMGIKEWEKYFCKENGDQYDTELFVAAVGQ